MTAIVETPGYQFLQNYKSDFYEIDQKTLLSDFEQGMTYLWTVRPNGTDLTRIGVHPKSSEWGTAVIQNALRATSLGAMLYLIDSRGVTCIDVPKATELLNRCDYPIKGSAVYRPGGQVLAVIAEKIRITKPGDANYYVDVHYEVASIDFLTKLELVTLREIAMQEAVVMGSSLFARIRSCTVNKRDIQDLIASAKPETIDTCDERVSGQKAQQELV